MITIFNWQPLAKSFQNNSFFSAGMILQVQTRIVFAVGGYCILGNAGSQNMFEADSPVFEYMQQGNTFRIVRNGASTDLVIAEKIDAYAVRTTTNLNLSAQPCFVCLETNVLNINPYQRFYFNVGKTINNYLSLQSNYNIALFNNTPTLLASLPYNTFGDAASPYHKPIDRNIHDYVFGSEPTRIDMFDRTGANGIRVFQFVFGISQTTLNLYNAKATTDLAANPRRLFWHVNPFLPKQEDYENQNSLNISLKFNFQRVVNSQQNEINAQTTIRLDHFGYFGERGNGQIAQVKPTNVLINGTPNGFLFTSGSQTLQFDLPYNSNNTTNTVYIVFQRKCTDYYKLKPDLSYQQNWGVSVIFSRPTGTTVQIGLTDTLVTGQCTSVVSLGGGQFRYSFQFNITRLADLLTWDEGLICYVVIDDAAFTESHILFEAAAQAVVPPIPQPSVTSFDVKPYYTQILKDDINYIALVPSLFLWANYELDVTAIANAKYKRIILRIAEWDNLFDLERYEIDLANHQIDSSGNIVYYKTIPTQSGTIQNHPSSFIEIAASGAAMYIRYPFLQRIEDWIALQPNAGIYFNNMLPNNGQNYNYFNYERARIILTLEYELNNQLGQFSVQNNLYFHDINKAIYNTAIPVSSIIAVTNIDNTLPSEYVAGGTYKLRLNNKIPYPTENCVSIRAVFIDSDNKYTWLTVYPSISNYIPLNTYAKGFTDNVFDDYEFKLPNKIGTLRFYVIFTKKPDATRDNMITRVYEINVVQKQDTISLPPQVNTQCCDKILVTNIDTYTNAYQGNAILSLYKNGDVVGSIPTTLINGFNFYTLNFQEILTLHGEGCYQVKNLDYESVVFELVTYSDAVANGTITITMPLTSKIGNFDFKANPVTLHYRLQGYIKEDNYTLDSEEVMFENGSSKKIKQEIKRNLKVLIKKLYNFDYNLFAIALAADSWVVSDFNKRNPIAYKAVEVLPPSALNPEWKLDNQWANLELDLNFVKYLKNSIC